MIAAVETGLAGQAHDGKVGRDGHADFGILRRDAAFRGGDVGPALEQVGRHAWRESRAGGVIERMEREWRTTAGGSPTSTAMACSNCGALLLEGGQLRLGRGQRRLRLLDIELRADATLEAAVGQVKVILVGLDRAVLHVDLGVERAQGEIVGGHIGAQHEQDVLKVRQGGLRLVPPMPQTSATHLAPDIDFITEIEGHDGEGVEGVGRESASAGRIPVGGARAAPRIVSRAPVGRSAGSAETGRFRDRSAIIRRRTLAQGGASRNRGKDRNRLPTDAPPRAPRLQRATAARRRLAVHLGARLELIQLGIVKDGVPIAARNLVLRLRLISSCPRISL